MTHPIVTFRSDFHVTGTYPCTVTCRLCGATFTRVSRDEVHPDTVAHRKTCPGLNK